MSLSKRTPFLTDERATFFSAAAIFLALALPASLSIPLRPLPAFLSELVLALLFFAGLSVLPIGKRVASLGLLLPASGLLLLLAVFPGGGGAVWAYASYIAVFVLAYCYGAASVEGASRALAYGLLACALLQSVAVCVQILGVGAPAWLPLMVGGRATGIVGQSNQLADLLLFGLAALCHPAFGRLKPVYRMPLALWLGLAVAASGSRSAWLGIAVCAIIGLRCRLGRERNPGADLLWIALAALIGQFLYPLLQHFGAMAETGAVGAISRSGTETSSGIRWYLAQVSWEAIKESPWLGHGAGSFWQVSIDAMQRFPVQGFAMLGEHAHNLPLNLAVEFGLPVSFLVCAALLYWAVSRLLALSPARAWALACVGVVLAHSMFEFPLWYTFFLVPCALCMGIVDGERPGRYSIRLPLKGLRFAGLLGLLACLLTAMEWMHVRLAWQQLVSSNEITARVMSLGARDELAQVSRFSVFGQQVGSLRLQSYLVDHDDLGLAAGDCEAHWRERPTWFMLKSCAEVFSAAGRAESLQHIVKAQCLGYYTAERKLLHDWAVAFDASGKGRIRLVGQACL